LGEQHYPFSQHFLPALRSNLLLMKNQQKDFHYNRAQEQEFRSWQLLNLKPIKNLHLIKAFTYNFGAI
jgi:hypothetical protein